VGTTLNPALNAMTDATSARSLRWDAFNVSSKVSVSQG
jgi:hypothetical protein